MALSAKEKAELERRRFRIGKSLGSARFALKHAGEGRAGAPVKKLSPERRKEIQAKVEALEAERRDIIELLEADEPKAEDEEPTEPSATTEPEDEIATNGKVEPLTAAQRRELKAKVDEAKREGLKKAA